ncbi:BTAD domain-containing putative transcriptional regulator [Amycolatopsis sp. NPDC059021]|uniref:AfsR/SARP family transcriptional regulator n=1 Tax=Amycolatopsis sp. NPDC059021 TaxID=3346704 RepID=UPI003671BA42
MHISVLGPFEVIRDGTDVTPTAPKLRLVLSMLSLHAGYSVSNEQLIDEIWEESPPASVITTLQTYIYQLRKLLRIAVPQGRRHGIRTTEPCLRTTPNGYLLELGAGTLDADEFEKLATHGKKLWESGDILEAADTLRAALDLWRGPALADVTPGTVLKASIARLDEIRANALDRRIDADLILGRHRELVGELTSLVAQQPTNEALQAKLMLALYRTGRRSEALQTYQHARSALADELGLDPSAALRRLHEQILAADPGLDAAAPGTVRVAGLAEPPCQLPRVGLPLSGRDDEIEQAVRTLGGENGAPAMVVVVGPPDIGKSAFCVTVGHRVRDLFPDGQLYAELVDADDQVVDTAEVLAGFLRAAGIPPAKVPGTLEERCQLFRSWTARRRVLVVLDDVTDARDVLALLPSGSACGVMLSGRRRLALPTSTTTIELRPLSTQDSLRLLLRTAGANRVRIAPAAARDLLRLCDGLPGVLRAAADQLQNHPHWTLARLLNWLRRRLDSTAFDTTDLHLVNGVRRSCRLLPPSAQAAVQAMAHHHTEWVSAAEAAALLGVDEFHAETMLEHLVEFQLAEATAEAPLLDTHRYRLRPVVRRTAGQLTVARADPLALPVAAGRR